jgi:hypothetical protein
MKIMDCLTVLRKGVPRECANNAGEKKFTRGSPEIFILISQLTLARRIWIVLQQSTAIIVNVVAEIS